MQENSRNEQNKKKNAVIWTVIVLLATAVITLGIFLGVAVSDKDKLRTQAENSYRSSYFTLADSILQIENSLSKMRVVRSDKLQSELLIKTSINAEVAEQCLNTLSVGNTDMQSTIKFCNQVQDYCLYLLSKIESDKDLSDTDYSALEKLYSASYQLGVRVNSLREDMVNDGYAFIDSLGKQDDAFSAIVTQIANGAIEYPSLIYDGPFSDGLEDPSPKTLDGEEITPEQGEEYVRKYAYGYEIASISFLGESGGYFDCLLYSFTDNSGKSGSVQISKTGGHLVMLDVYDEVEEPAYTRDDALQLASQYCEKLGYADMTAVWSCVTDSELYVNMCYEQDGIIFYPDMLKIKVSLQTGKVVGFESLEYIYNHDKNRDTDYNVTVTEEEVLAAPYGQMKIKSVRLAVIPYGAGSERLAYEVYGMLDDYQFFVYVDAETGQELKVLQVIDSDEGELLM